MAAILIERLMAAIDALRDLPLSGHVVQEWNDPELREIPSYNYRIFYRVHNNTVTIFAIIHGSRQLPDSLKYRLG